MNEDKADFSIRLKEKPQGMTRLRLELKGPDGFSRRCNELSRYDDPLPGGAFNIGQGDGATKAKAGFHMCTCLLS